MEKQLYPVYGIHTVLLDQKQVDFFDTIEVTAALLGYNIRKGWSICSSISESDEIISLTFSLKDETNTYGPYTYDSREDKFILMIYLLKDKTVVNIELIQLQDHSKKHWRVLGVKEEVIISTGQHQPLYDLMRLL